MSSKQCHPLLRERRIGGGDFRKSSGSHGLSEAEMESLKSICEVLIPPLTNLDSFEGKEESTNEAVKLFYSSSGAQTPIPDEVIYYTYK